MRAPAGTLRRGARPPRLPGARPGGAPGALPSGTGGEAPGPVPPRPHRRLVGEGGKQPEVKSSQVGQKFSSRSAAMAKEGPAEPQGGGKGEGKGLKEGQGGKEEGKEQQEDPPLPPLRRLRAAARLLRQVVGAKEAGRQGPGRALRWTAQVRHAGLRAAHG